MKICTSCQRYLKSEEVKCPFCASSALKEELGFQGVGRGLSRAKVFAARAAIAGATLGAAAACGDDQDSEEPTAQSGGQSSSGGAEASGGMASDGTGDHDHEVQGGQGGVPDVVVPIYGGPFPDMMKARV